MARRSIQPIVREIVAWLRGSEHGSYRDDLRHLINDLAEVIEAKTWGKGGFANARYEFTTRADVTVDGVFIVYRRTRALPDMHPAVAESLGRLRRV
jgi:hypothetical protein